MTAVQDLTSSAPSAGRGFRAYSEKHLDELVGRAGLDAGGIGSRCGRWQPCCRFGLNAYVVDELIDWDAAPDDPIYRLVFPQPDMLPEEDVRQMSCLLASGASGAEVQRAARRVRMKLNPHPAGQLILNVPQPRDEPLPGVQHKYAETVLLFPRQGQTCHAYCAYCFRWAQFVGEPDLKMATDDIDRIAAYLGDHPEVTSVLLTGGDPMIMGSTVLRRYIRPLLDPRLDHLESIRIGSKSLAYWPQRFVGDPDADDTLRLFEEVVTIRSEPGLHGALLSSTGTRATGGGRGGAPDRRHRRRHQDPGATHQVHQRLPDDLGGHVAPPASDGHGALLHVRRARHGSAELFRRSARAGL